MLADLPEPLEEVFRTLFTRTCDIVEACLGDESPLMCNKIKKILLDEANDCKRKVANYFAEVDDE